MSNRNRRVGGSDPTRVGSDVRRCASEPYPGDGSSALLLLCRVTVPSPHFPVSGSCIPASEAKYWWRFAGGTGRRTGESGIQPEIRSAASLGHGNSA
jgi:hypothetical protein